MVAPLPPDNTTRYYFVYKADTAQHTLVCRIQDSAPSVDVPAAIDALFTAMTAILTPIQFVKFEVSGKGSSVRLPAEWTGSTNWGTGTSDPENAPQFFSFTGKDSLGHKARVEVFGRGGKAGDDWRVLAADNSAVAAAIEALAAPDGAFTSISGGAVFWNAYCNQSISQHWVGQARK